MFTFPNRSKFGVFDVCLFSLLMCMDSPPYFAVILSKGDNFVTSCLLLWVTKHFFKGFYLHRGKFNYVKVVTLAKLGPVVQSIASLKSLLRDQLVECLMTLLPNTLIFFVEKMRKAFAMQKLLTFFQQKYWCI